MLEIVIPETTMFDEETNTFIDVPEQKLQMEHSLVSISKWESKYHRPFLGKEEKTFDEILDYMEMMILNDEFNKMSLMCLTQENVEQINEYIGDPMTATTFGKGYSKGGNSKQITSELIYYWMVALNINFECEKWHINRLLTLIRVCNVENEPPKKKSKKQTMADYAALNAARRKQLNTKG